MMSLVAWWRTWWRKRIDYWWWACSGKEHDGAWRRITVACVLVGLMIFGDCCWYRVLTEVTIHWSWNWRQSDHDLVSLTPGWLVMTLIDCDRWQSGGRRTGTDERRYAGAGGRNDRQMRLMTNVMMKHWRQLLSCIDDDDGDTMMTNQPVSQWWNLLTKTDSGIKTANSIDTDEEPMGLLMKWNDVLQLMTGKLRWWQLCFCSAKTDVLMTLMTNNYSCFWCSGSRAWKRWFVTLYHWRWPYSDSIWRAWWHWCWPVFCMKAIKHTDENANDMFFVLPSN